LAKRELGGKSPLKEVKVEYKKMKSEATIRRDLKAKAGFISGVVNTFLHGNITGLGLPSQKMCLTTSLR